jgi:hypothetical protein
MRQDLCYKKWYKPCYRKRPQNGAEYEGPLEPRRHVLGTFPGAEAV